MVLTKDEELWGAALAVEKQHGSRAEAYVAERVAAAAQVGDGQGVETMLAIATRLDALKPGPLAS